MERQAKNEAHGLWQAMRSVRSWGPGVKKNRTSQLRRFSRLSALSITV